MIGQLWPRSGGGGEAGLEPVIDVQGDLSPFTFPQGTPFRLSGGLIRPQAVPVETVMLLPDVDVGAFIAVLKCFPNSSALVDMGIVFAYQDVNNFHLAHLSMNESSPTSAISLFRKSGGSFSSTESTGMGGGGIPADGQPGWLTVTFGGKVEATPMAGLQFQWWLQDPSNPASKPVAVDHEGSWSATPVTPGKVGLRMGSGISPDALFDFRLWDVSDLYAL